MPRSIRSGHGASFWRGPILRMTRPIAWPARSTEPRTLWAGNCRRRARRPRPTRSWPRRDPGGESAVEDAMVDVETQIDIAVRIGRAVAEQARQGRPRGAELGLPARDRRDGVGSERIPACLRMVQAEAPDQAAKEQRQPCDAKNGAIKPDFLDRRIRG